MPPTPQILLLQFLGIYLPSSTRPPSEGEITIDGNNLIRTKPSFRKKVGYLAENNPLYQDMTTQEFLSFVASLKGLSFRKRKQVISDVVEQCGIGVVCNRIIGKLSKGFRQRIGLAQALVGDPAILILDEPTSGLDPKQIIEIRNLIRELGTNRTILLSSHILPEVKATCDRILILNEGRLVASGTPQMLEERLRGAEELFVTVRGSWENGDSFLRLLPGILETKLLRDGGKERDYKIVSEQGKEIRSQLARRVFESGFELLTLKAAEWNLEDIFLKIVTKESEELAACSD